MREWPWNWIVVLTGIVGFFLVALAWSWSFTDILIEVFSRGFVKGGHFRTKVTLAASGGAMMAACLFVILANQP